MNPYYESRPPKTAVISRKIWDLVTEYKGREPVALWKNWNGIVFGLQMGDADYGDWKYDYSNLATHAQSVPEYILVMAKSRFRNMLFGDWLKEHCPERLARLHKEIEEHKQKHSK